MDFTKIQSKDVWRNDGREETIEPLKKSGIHVLAIDHITVNYEHDRNYSMSFELRHVVDKCGNRGFAYYVDPEQVLSYADTFRPGISRSIYDEVLREGTAAQQEFLRRAWINLNRR